jgi:hypothetical protein
VSLGLPGHLVPYHVRRGLSRAAHVVALVCISSGTLVVLSLQSQLPNTVLWPALIAFGIMLAALWFVDRNPTVVTSLVYLGVTTVCVYWITLIAMTQFPGDTRSDTFVLSMAKVAVIMVGGVGVGTLSGILWTVSGFALAGIATAVASWQTGGGFVFDLTAIAAVVLLIALQIGLEAGRSARRSAQPSLHRAARDEQLSAMRYRIEVKAAAVMHDTVLNHLAAIATAPDGELNPQLRAQVERDLEVLVGEEWLLDADPGTHDEARIEWMQSRLYRVVEDVRALGLEVQLSGELSAVSRLGVERSTAVALATKQCLINVLKHAGTESAELVVYGSDREISVMVIDAGKGFSESETGSDRLGLRQSVRRRIENVGGTVQVWSTPGRGTSVMIRVPALEPEVVVTGIDESDDEVRV